MRLSACHLFEMDQVTGQVRKGAGAIQQSLCGLCG